MSDPGNLPIFGLLSVRVTLELIGEHNGATAIAHSALDPGGQRIIRSGLCANHLLVNRALQRADTVSIRFFVALALVEFCQFWANSRDGASVCRELRKLAGYQSHENAWGSGVASRLSVSDPQGTSLIFKK